MIVCPKYGGKTLHLDYLTIIYLYVNRKTNIYIRIWTFISCNLYCSELDLSTVLGLHGKGNMSEEGVAEIKRCGLTTTPIPHSSAPPGDVEWRGWGGCFYFAFTFLLLQPASNRQ